MESIYSNMIISQIIKENKKFIFRSKSLNFRFAGHAWFSIFFFPSSFCDQFLQEWPDFIGVHFRREVIHHFTIFVQHKLRKIPWNVFSHPILIQRAIHLQESVKWVSIWPIHKDLWEHRELHLIVGRSKVVDLFFWVWFLCSELIAGESENF